MKLLSDEAKKREMKIYFDKCQKEYYNAYNAWRNNKKAYLKLSAEHKREEDTKKEVV